jgi:hypothetical protein
VNVRRVVTGVDGEGKSTIVSDGPPPNAHTFDHIPGYASAIAWATGGTPVSPNDGSDPTSMVRAMVPSPGSTVVVIVEMPPDSVRESAAFDREAAEEEMRSQSLGIVDYFEAGSTFHATPSVDYHIMLEGEIWLLLDGGGETLISAGDIVIQNGTRHTWANRSSSPARYATVLVGAHRRS